MIKSRDAVDLTTIKSIFNKYKRMVVEAGNLGEKSRLKYVRKS